ncbi:MAG: preprotein translocase subunit SecG [Planctomycetota bacterium]
MFSLFQGLMAILLILTSAFMILLILVQRGRGGGLTGALGGAGGQSAFGSKAGDVFTRITIGTAVVWIVLAMMTISIFNPPPRPIVLENPAGSMRGSGDATQPGDTKDGDTNGKAQPGVSELNGEQLPGEGASSSASELPGAGSAQPADPNLNPPKQESPTTSPEAAPAEGGNPKSGETSGGGN